MFGDITVGAIKYRCIGGAGRYGVVVVAIIFIVPLDDEG
jgi:hypothetical protein